MMKVVAVSGWLTVAALLGAVQLQAQAQAPVVTSATLKATCMNDGSIKFEVVPK